MRRLVRGFGPPLLLALALTGCTDGSRGVQSTPSRSPSTAPVETPSPSPAPSPTSSPIPIPTGGVVPTDPDGFAGVVANSLVAVVRAGNIEFVDRVLQDAHSSSTCTPFPDIHVLSKQDAGMERKLVSRSIHRARALEQVDGVGHARGRMNPGAEWPGVPHPFVVAVVLAVDCPEE